MVMSTTIKFIWPLFLILLFGNKLLAEEKSGNHKLQKNTGYEFTSTVENFRYFDGTAKQQFADFPREIYAKIPIGNPRKGTTTAEIKEKFEVQDIVKDLNQFRDNSVEKLPDEQNANRLKDLGLSDKVAKSDKVLKTGKDKNPSFVLFHVVHSGFGGKAEYDNLVAMTNSANQVYYREVESKLKQFTANEVDILKQIQDLELKTPNEVESKIKKLKEKLGDVKEKDYKNKYPESGYELHVTPNYVKSDLPKQQNGKIYYDGNPVPYSLTIKMVPFGSDEFKKTFYQEFPHFKIEDGYLVGHLKNDGNSKLLQEKPKTPEYNENSNHLKNAYDKIAADFEETKNIRQHSPNKIENTQDGPQNKNEFDIGDDAPKTGNSGDLTSHCHKSGPSCVFITGGSDDENVNSNNKKVLDDVVEVRSKEFVAEYKRADDSKKRILAEIAEKNKVKITGDPDSVKTVQKLIELENIKKHNAKIEYGTHVLKTGEFYGPKSKTGGYNEMELLKGTKISRSKLAKTLSKHEKGINKAGKISNRVSKFFLAKAIASGIINGDGTSLAIIGARVAGDIFLSNAGKMSKAFSTKFATELATKTGKRLGLKLAGNAMLRGLAKSAGVLGLAVDVGFSAWNLASAVQTYRNPNSTVWEQNNAIADMVGETIDILASIAVFAIVATASAPVAMVAAGVGIIFYLVVSTIIATYKATNHVNMLDSNIKLLGFEKSREFSRNFMGVGTSDYIIRLIATKEANNIAVNISIQFLKENPQYLKIISPSILVEDFKECVIKEEYCDYHFFWVCTGVATNTVSGFKGGVSDCYSRAGRMSGRTYSSYWGTDYYFDNKYKCDCQTKQKYSPHKNSKVDFHSKMYVYPERSKPTNIENGFEIFCQPSSINSRGYQISEDSTKYSYLCENAFGIRRKSGSGTLTLFDLGDGTDEIYISETDKSENVILVDNGEKFYYGGPGREIFFIRNCDSLFGVLDGEGGGEDVLQLGDECASSHTVTISGYRLYSRTMRRLDIKLRSIEIIQGRANKAEEIICGCETKSVAGRGGRQGSPDTITVLEERGCSYNLSIHAEEFTVVHSSAKNGLVQVFVSEQNYKTFTSSAKLYKSVITNYFLPFPFHYLKSAKCNVYFPFGLEGPLGNYTVDLVFKNEQKINLLFRAELLEKVKNGYLSFQPGITFAQQNGDSYILILEKTGICEGWHLLKSSISMGRQQRNGALFISNAFRLFSGSWDVIGGNQPDTFILTGNDFCGKIYGNGGINSFLVNESVSVATVVISNSYDMGLCTYSHRSISLVSVQHFSGRFGKADHFISNCDTRSIAGKGGRDSQNPDLLKIGYNTNSACIYDLTVIVSKYTKVISEASRGNITFEISKEGLCDFEFIQTDLITIRFQLDFPLSHLNKCTSSVSTDRNNLPSYKIILHLANNQNVNFEFQYLRNDTDYLSGPDIIFVGAQNDIEAAILIDKVSASVSILHTLNKELINDPLTTKTGAQNTPNVFQCSRGNWLVHGGNLNDHFILYSHDFKGILKGEGGFNSLMLQESLEGEILVHLEKGHIKTSSIPNWTVEIEDIHNVIGRSWKRDIIHAACSSKIINGKGGSDLVIISDNNNCNYDLMVVAEDSTTIESSATKGNLIFDLVKNDGPSHFTAHFTVTPAVKMNFQINYPISELVHSETNFARFEDGELWYTIALNFLSDRKAGFRFKNEEIIKECGGNYLSRPGIVFVGAHEEIEAKLLVQSNSGAISILHTLNKTNSVRARVGAKGVSNLFQLLSGKWFVRGGNFNDFFILDSTQFNGLLNGDGGINTLILNNDIPDEITVNFEKGYINNNKISNWEIKLENINIVKGRSNKSDTIYCSCSTKDVDGQGGIDIFSKDQIIIPKMANCRYEQMTINVMRHTSIQNHATSGDFRYIVHYWEDIPNIQITPGNSRHTFQFQFGIDIFKSVSFNLTSKKLTFETFSNVSVSLNMEAGDTKNSDYADPKLLFVELDKKGNSVQYEVGVRGNGAIYTYIRINDTFLENVIGLQGTENNFVINGPGYDFGILLGNIGDDNFWINSARSIREINGGKGKHNSLKILESLYSGEMLMADLYSDDGGITFLNDSEHYFVERVRNIQIFTGRNESFERVIVGCDTRRIEKVDQVIFIDERCPQYDIAINVDKNTSVQFESGIFINNDEFEEEIISNYENGSFVYLFDELTSFSLLVDDWDILGSSKHVFYLKFKITDLDEIGFSEFNLTYSISNETFRHSVNYNVEEDQQFYSQPNFVTLDGFHIQVTMYGEIFMTYGNLDQDVDLDFISTKLVSVYGSLANKLQANIIFRTKSDFIYIGYKNRNGGLETTNLLTNTNSRSHLVGGGGNNTIYSILDPNFDTYVYPGFQNKELRDENGLPIKHVLDLTQTASIIRNFTQSKYIPSIIENSNDLIIVWENWEHVFPGKIILVEGKKYVSHFQILLNVVAMELSSFGGEKIDEKSKSIHKRDVNGQIKWQIVPIPISIEQGTTILVSADDLEDNQEIRYEPSSPDSENETSITTFKMASMEGDLVVSNLAATDDISKAITFVILDYYDPINGVKENDSALHHMNNVKLNLGDVNVEVNEIEIDKVGNWEDVLEESEEVILKDLPHIPRTFKISFWKRHMNSVSICLTAFLTFSAVVFITYIIYGKKCKNKPHVDSNPTRAEIYESVPCTEFRRKSENEEMTEDDESDSELSEECSIMNDNWKLS